MDNAKIKEILVKIPGGAYERICKNKQNGYIKISKKKWTINFGESFQENYTLNPKEDNKLFYFIESDKRKKVEEKKAKIKDKDKLIYTKYKYDDVPMKKINHSSNVLLENTNSLYSIVNEMQMENNKTNKDIGIINDMNQNKKYTVKKDRKTIIDDLNSLYTKKDYYEFDELNRHLKQNKEYLKNILEDVCEYASGKYSLKDRYKKNNILGLDEDDY